MAHFPMLGGKRIVTAATIGLVLCAGLAAARAGDTPSPVLLVLHKGENAMAIIDPNTGAGLGQVPTGQDPHELAVSEDGRSPSRPTTPAGGAATASPSSTSRPGRRTPRRAGPARPAARALGRGREGLLHGRGESGHRPLRPGHQQG